MTKPSPDHPWHVPVALHEVPETGRHFDLVAEAGDRAGVAKLAGVEAVPQLAASFDVSRHGADGLRVLGRVTATVEQICVVTLEPMQSEIEEPIDVTFTPAAAERFGKDAAADVALTDEGPEPLVNGRIDLGALATEFLILGIDPHPRKPGAVFEPPAAAADDAHPFSVLAALKKGRSGDDP